MRIVVTGADGFLGRRLVDRLLAAGGMGDGFEPVSQLVLMDLQMRRAINDQRVLAVTGNFADAQTRGQALAGGVDVLFHLASLPGGAAQAHYDRGRAVNLDGSMALIDAVTQRSTNGSASSKPPIVVFASSIAAIGPTQFDLVSDDTPPRPQGSYGCHKLMVETHLADLTARKWIDARSLRPAGIVPRPRDAFDGFATAWMSDVFHAMANGEPFQMPVAADATTWLQSLDCVVDNVLHAARLPAAGLPAHRAWTLPALNPRMDALVQAIAEQTNPAHAQRVRFAAPPVASFAASPGSAAPARQYAGMPNQCLPRTEALGFQHDGSLAALVQRALAALGS